MLSEPRIDVDKCDCRNDGGRRPPRRALLSLRIGHWEADLREKLCTGREEKKGDNTVLDLMRWFKPKPQVPVTSPVTDSCLATEERTE